MSAWGRVVRIEENASLLPFAFFFFLECNAWWRLSSLTEPSVARERWRYPRLEHIDTLNWEDVLTIHDGILVSRVPQILNVPGNQSPLLIPGLLPLCLRCDRAGHVRWQCRTILRVLTTIVSDTRQESVCSPTLTSCVREREPVATKLSQTRMGDS